MFLQDGKPRRKPLVYGKMKRSTPAYNVFDLDDTIGGGTQSRSSPKKDEGLSGQQHIHGQVSKMIETTPKGKFGNFRRRRTSKQKQGPAISSTQKESASKNDMGRRTSAFDLPLSDEEDTSTILFERSMQKRRRLTPVRNQCSNITPRQRKPSGPSTNEDSMEYTQSIRAANILQGQTKTLSECRTTRLSPRRTRKPAPEDDSSSYQVAFCNTPKQTRILSHLLENAGPTDSPSGLPLTSLSLTNGEHSKPGSVELSSKPLSRIDQIPKRLPRTKKRLIDAMVSPRKRLSVSSDSSSEGSALGPVDTFGATYGRRIETQTFAVAQAHEVNGVNKTEDVVRNNSSTSSTGARPRVTYSRERSHLADMLTDDLLDPVSQSASQEESLVLSQNGAIFSSFTSVMSHEGSEEELEQEVAGIRSIHELRHSGVSARSQVDLESILEDIEATGPSSRARRLRGLSQLTERLGDPEIGRHISDQSLDQRLSRCSHFDGDVVGQTLVVMILSRLMISVQLPIASLKRVFDALVRSGTNVLQQSRELATIVRDRKQNLSRASCREITALVEPFCASLVWPHQRPKLLIPRLMFIRCMDIVLRQARQLGDFSMVLPASIFSRLVQLLLQIAPDQLGDAKDNDSVLVMESTVSIIESLTISRNWAEDGCLEIAKELSGLGPILDQLTVSSAESSDRTHHLILRLILNITNNDSDLCDAFSEPALLSAIFGLVRRDFLQTSMSAKAGLKESTLEGVILALGALSNLAEHSSTFRQAMLDNSLDGRSMVDWIALSFRDQVEVASEASSVEQTISLVAFGYLSVLLCNVCMDRQIRNQVRGLLKGGTLQTLLLFVQEFLDHFRRAEELESKREDDEQTMKSGFVDRFEGVLDALRQAEGSR